jgi:hypothetical protein
MRVMVKVVVQSEWVAGARSDRRADRPQSCRALDLPVSGSVGVLKPLLEEMVRQRLYFSARFIAAVLRQVGE